MTPDQFDALANQGYNRIPVYREILADLENAHFVLAGRCWRCESWYKFTGVIYLVVVKSAQFNFVCEE